MSDADLREAGGTQEAGETGEGRDRRIRAIRGGSGQSLGSTAPAFSQPVRQILMMLIVLGLVAAGGWYAYGRILSIFAANRMLNGVILLVFAIGVITCFWQVAQLVKSVNWIEAFAARRRNAVERGVSAASESDVQEAPTLLAPLAALLGRSGPAAGVLSTASARSIQDSVATRIDEARDITRYLSSLLIFLGLLGTFYGLATTVPAVVETIRALSPEEGESGLQIFDKLMSGLEGQLGGMATAFSSSLLGLAGSLVIGLLELFATHGQNRFYRELEEWMSGFTRIGLSGADGESLDQATVAGFLDQITDQMSDLHNYYLNRDADREAQSRASEDRIARMTGGIETLAGQILAQGQAVRDQAEASGAAFSRMAEGHDRLIARIDAGAEAQLGEARGAGQAIARLAEAQSGLSAHLRTASEAASAAAAGANAARAHEAELGQVALQRLVESQQILTADLRQRDAELRLGADSTAQALIRLVEGQEILIKLAGSAATGAGAISQPVTAESDEGQMVAREAQMHLRSIDHQLARMAEEIATNRADMIGELREDLAALTRAIRRLGQGDEA